MSAGFKRYLVGRSRVVLLSYLISLCMSLGFAFATARRQIVCLFALYGVFYAIDEAQSKAFIAGLEPIRRAAAIGVYNPVAGILYLPASLIAGVLWLAHPTAVFVLGALLSLTAIAALMRLQPGRG